MTLSSLVLECRPRRSPRPSLGAPTSHDLRPSFVSASTILLHPHTLVSQNTTMTTLAAAWDDRVALVVSPTRIQILQGTERSTIVVPKEPQQLVWANATTLGVVTKDALLLLDLSRGVVDWTYDCPNLVGAAFEKNDWYLLTSNHRVHVLHGDGKLVRKLKAGGTGIAVLSSSQVVARHETYMRVLDAKTGKKLHKVEVAGSGAVVAVGSQVVTATPGGLWIWTSKADLKQVVAVGGEPDRLQAVSADRHVRILYGNTIYDAEGAVVATYKEDDESILLLSSQSATIAQRRKGEWKLQSTPWKDLTSDWSWIEEAEPSSAKKDKSSTKRSQAAVLGPGQVGGESATTSDGPPPAKKAKETTEPTIADRLAQLHQAMDEDEEEDEDVSPDEDASFVPRKATTESLTKVLSQALQSGDDGMLELALGVRDERIIRETCAHLSDEHLNVLFTALTVRLSSKPSRAMDLCVWITCVLQTHKVQSMQQLQPLRNLLQERLEVFPALLQLDGRLSWMTQQH